MGCCGGHSVLQQARAITTGFGKLALEHLSPLPPKDHAQTDARLRTCQKCPERTWLTKMEWLTFAAGHVKDMVTHIADLSALPALPRREYRPGAHLFCTICKCLVPAKARVKQEHCPRGLWKD